MKINTFQVKCLLCNKKFVVKDKQNAKCVRCKNEIALRFIENKK